MTERVIVEGVPVAVFRVGRHVAFEPVVRPARGGTAQQGTERAQMRRFGAVAGAQHERTVHVVADIAFVGEADRAMHLYRFARDRARTDVRAVDRAGRQHRSLRRIASFEPRQCIRDDGGGELVLNEHIDGAMLQGLKAPERAAELLARAQIVERRLERLRHESAQVGGTEY